MKYGREIAQQTGCECWGINYMTLQVPELTLLFQMHGDSFIRARFLDHYRQFPPKVPVIMHHRWREIPTSTVFPMRDYAQQFGLIDRCLVDTPMKGDHAKGLLPRGPYASCSMSYMLALALLMGHYDLIYLYGIDLYYELRHEAEFERPCVEWHMGFLQAAGIRFVIPENSRLMCTENNPRMIYGLEWNPALRLDELDKINAESERACGVIRHENTYETREAAPSAAIANGGCSQDGSGSSSERTGS
jgi:hypothetical protein